MLDKKGNENDNKNMTMIGKKNSFKLFQHYKYNKFIGTM